MNAKEALGPWLKRYWGLEIVMSDSHTVTLSDAASDSRVRAVLEAAAALVRYHLDNTEVHPCDRDNDNIRALECPREVQALRDALMVVPNPSNPDVILALIRELVGAQQATIDELMVEYCPDEMTAEQVRAWGEHQRPCRPASDSSENEATK